MKKRKNSLNPEPLVDSARFGSLFVQLGTKEGILKLLSQLETQEPMLREAISLLILLAIGRANSNGIKLTTGQQEMLQYELTICATFIYHATAEAHRSLLTGLLPSQEPT